MLNDVINALNILTKTLENKTATSAEVISNAINFSTELTKILPDLRGKTFNPPGKLLVNNEELADSRLHMLAASKLWLDGELASHVPLHLIRTGWHILLKEALDELKQLQVQFKALVNQAEYRLPKTFQCSNRLIGLWDYLAYHHRLTCFTAGQPSLQKINFKFPLDRLAFCYQLIVFGETLKKMPPCMNTQLMRIKQIHEKNIEQLSDLRDKAAHFHKVENISEIWSFLFVKGTKSTAFIEAKKTIDLILKSPELLHDIGIGIKLQQPSPEDIEQTDEQPNWLKHILSVVQNGIKDTRTEQHVPPAIEPFEDGHALMLGDFTSVFSKTADRSTTNTRKEKVADLVYPNTLDGDASPITIPALPVPDIHDINGIVQFLCDYFNELRAARQKNFGSTRSDYIHIALSAERMLVILLGSLVHDLVKKDELNDALSLFKELRNHFCHFANLDTPDDQILQAFERLDTDAILTYFQLSDSSSHTP